MLLGPSHLVPRSQAYIASNSAVQAARQHLSFVYVDLAKAADLAVRALCYRLARQVQFLHKLIVIRLSPHVVVHRSVLAADRAQAPPLGSQVSHVPLQRFAAPVDARAHRPDAGTCGAGDLFIAHALDRVQEDRDAELL